MDGQRLKAISKLALPMIGGMCSGNLLSLIDTAMVGTLGNAALAGVGLGSLGQAFGMSVIFGLASAVQAMVSRRAGQQRTQDLAHPLNGGLAAALIIGAPFCLLYYAAAPWFFNLILSDQAVIEQGLPYFRALVLGLVPLGMNFAFRGFWNGFSRPAVYMRTIITIHITNVVLNYLLIFGRAGFPQMGALGAGLASSLSVAVGTLTYFILAWRHARPFGFLKSSPLALLKPLLKLSLPTSVQNLMMALGGVVFLGIVAQIGTREMAAANVLLRITRACLFPAVALGFTASTLVGQALGKLNPRDAAQWAWDVVRCAFLLLFAMGLPLIIMPQTVLRIFIEDPLTLQLATLPLRLVGLGLSLGATTHALMYSLLGAGDNRWVMMASVGINWGVYLPFVWLTGIVLDLGLEGVFSAQAGYGLLMTMAFALRMHGGNWTRHRL